MAFEAGGPPPAPETLADYPALARFLQRSHPANWYLAREQKPVPGFQVMAAPPGHDFRRVRVGRAVAYSFGFATFEPFFRHTDKLLMDDGTLAPFAVAPGRELTEAQTARLLAALPQERPRVPKVRCDFTPVWGVVFHSDEGAPLFDVRVGPDRIASNAGGSHLAGPMLMSPAIQSALWRVCEELDLPGCRRFERVALDIELSLLPRDAEGRATSRSPDTMAWSASGLPRDNKLRDLTLPERRLACAWKSAASRYFADNGFVLRGGMAYECDNGLTASNHEYEECVAEFPTCNSTVGQVEACLVSLTRDPCAPATGCLDLCHYGFEYLTPPR